jgi:rod shape-determining protein MreD
MIIDGVKAFVLVTAAAIVQVAFVNAFELVEGHADVVLLAVVGIALLRGPLFGACAGFWAGLIVDTMTLGTLGLTSLLLTVGGYWAGRLGEATSDHHNQRARVLIAVTLLTVAVELGSLVVHALLGDSASVGTVIGRVLLPTLALNVALALPANWVIRRLFPPPARREREIVIGGAA